MITTARRTVAEHLRESQVGDTLGRLPAGRQALVRRPAGPPATWPDFHAAARERWSEDRRRRAA